MSLLYLHHLAKTLNPLGWKLAYSSCICICCSSPGKSLLLSRLHMRRRFVSLHLSRPKGKNRKTVTISMVALQHSRQTQSSNYAISTKQLLPLRVIATGSGREGKRTSHLQIWLSKGKENC